ncbi:MAG: sel1 repeat family protein [Victivallales bacterium]|nr:sel1 repeat family protein [Victivallales bacterium]
MKLRACILNLILLGIAIALFYPWTAYISLQLAQRLAAGKMPFESASKFFQRMAIRQDADLVQQTIEEIDQAIADEQFDMAKEKLSQIVKRHPTLPQQQELRQRIDAAYSAYQQAQGEAARRAWEAGNWQEANKRAIHADQGNPYILYIEGCCSLRQGDFQRAGNFLRRSANLDNPDAILELGKLYEQKKFSATEQEMEHWMRQALKADHLEASLPLSTVLLQSSRVSEAFECLRQATYRGCTAAAHRLGDLYAQGVPPLRPSPQEASQWYEIAANQGDEEAVFLLAKLYESPQTGITSPQTALKWYERAAKGGNQEAQCRLGAIFEHGLGVPRDLQQALTWYQTAAELGSETAKQWLADFQAKRLQAQKKEEERLAQVAKEKAEKHSSQPFARIRLAIKEKDWHTAFQLVKNADQSHPYIQALLAEMYLKGQGTAPNAKLALQHARKSAQQGNLRGKYILAQCFLSQSQTHLNAMQPLEDVAKSNPSSELSLEEITEAQTRLAYIHIFGESSQCKPLVAIKWATKAMHNGSAEGAYLLGWVYLYGIGVERNPSIAKSMLLWSHQHGYEKATILLKKLPK